MPQRRLTQKKRRVLAILIVILVSTSDSVSYSTEPGNTRSRPPSMNHLLPTSSGMDGLWITPAIIFFMMRGTYRVLMVCQTEGQSGGNVLLLSSTTWGFIPDPCMLTKKGCLFTVAKNTAAGFLRYIPQKCCRGVVILVNLPPLACF